ncbi:MAG: glycosyl transferase, partial [Chloroflexi bacterium]|nr:glycosyl transferase [Chloroflexota bacterium]
VADVLTIIWVVGLTNAFNLLDNMDGLAAGIALLTALALAAFSVSFGDPRVALLCFLLAGACAGFLVYNFNPARIFMGDSGSLTLGFFLSAVALLGTSTMAGGVVLTLAVPVLVMALPILDTTLVTIVRILHGRSPAQGGRDHLSHRLVALGLSERQAVVMLYVLSAAFGVLAFVANVVDLWLAAALGALGLIAVVLFAIFLAHVRVYTDAEYRQAPAPPDRATVVGGVLMFKRQVFELLLDFNLVCVAYLGAYLLKFEGTLSGLFLVQFSQSLPYVIAVKLTALLAFGVYRAVWRYLSLPDLLTLAKASTAGTLGSMLIVWVVFRFELFSRSVFVIDWLLLTTLLVASRLSFRGLRDWFARLPRAQATRALIAGAGDEAELTLRTLLRDPNRSIEPVGLLDDDQAKLNRRIHGVPVLGRLGDLEKLATEHRVEVLVIALSGEQEVTTAELIGSCERLDLDYRLVRSPFA